MTVIQLPMPETDYGLTFEDLLHFDPGEGYRTELFEGRFVVSPPPFIPHAFAASSLHAMLTRSLPLEFSVIEGPGVYVTENNYFIPDLVVIHKDSWDRYEKGFLPGDVLLTVEVISPSSSSYDNIAKRHAYAKAGLQHYWIMDPRTRAVQILELGNDGSYMDRELIQPGQRWTSSVPFVVTVDPEALFKR